MQLKPLMEDDIVDIVAPASKCPVAELKNGLRMMRELGLRPRLPSDVFGKSLLFSNSDSVRLKHLRKALYARDSKMIWCARGGYGALRLMSEMEKWKKPAQPKIFLGYSDITTLHLLLNQKWQWPTLHGPMVGAFGRGALAPKQRQELLDVLFGRALEVEFKHLTALNAAARGSKTIRGPVNGGNMVVMQSSLGTPSAFRPRSGILFFEDVGERPHRVDRMLEQFRQAGWFEKCSAVLFGDFTARDPVDAKGLWRDVFPRFAASVKVPVLSEMPVGHVPERQRVLPLNTTAVLRCGSQPSLVVATGICAR